MHFILDVNGNGAYNVRLSATQLQTNPSIKSMSITAVPEPATYAVLAGLFAFGKVMLRQLSK
ncbi:hypothetical protein ACWPKO_12615 [Coraliomargarita sp. W4R53]